MSYKGFKKHSSDGNVTVFKRPDGHELRVAHKALTPEYKKKLDALPSFAYGGQFEGGGNEEPIDPVERHEADIKRKLSIDSPAGSYAPENTPEQIKQMAADEADSSQKYAESEKNRAAQEVEVRNMRLKEMGAPPEAMAPALAPAPSIAPAQPVLAPQTSAVAPEASPVATAAPSQVAPQPAQMGAVGQFNKGVNQEAAAIGAQGKEEADLAANYIKDQNEMMAAYQAEDATAKQQIADLTEDVKNGHVNPNHYQESLSSGQKVMNAIGMILSGFGSGLAHQENLAAKFINSQIDRDIAAQEKDMGKRENLLKHYEQQYGNIKDARLMTSASLKSIYATKLEQVAASYKDDIAKARAMQEAAKFRQGAEKDIAKVSQSQAAAKIFGAAIKNESEYKAKLNALAPLSPEMHKELKDSYIPGVGIADVKPTEKDREALASAKPMIDALTELQALAIKHGTTVPGSAQDLENKTKVAALQLDLKGPAAYNMGQISGADKGFMDSVVKDPGSLRTGATIRQLEATKKNLMAKYDATLKKLAITPFQSANPMEGKTATGPNGQKIVMQNGQWVPFGK